jgi:hypothetical protein
LVLIIFSLFTWLPVDDAPNIPLAIKCMTKDVVEVVELYHLFVPSDDKAPMSALEEDVRLVWDYK